MIQGEAIAAIASGRGLGAVSLLRASGEGIIQKTAGIFRGQQDLNLAAERMLNLGWVIDPISGEKIDQVMVAVFRSPASYTGEDMVEIYCHGGAFVTSSVLSRVLGSGCRLAKAGEFTQRAFLNGKMNLSQAEAVSEIVNARTSEQRRMAIFQLRGEKESRLWGIRQKMENWIMHLEGDIEFPEDEGAPRSSRRDFWKGWASIVAEMISELDLFEKARHIRDGLLVPIVGRPNAGKSTMFNWFCKSERVIVDSEPGTTRDAVEEELEVCGIAVRLVDTAGIRITENRVERRGIERTRELINKADLVLWVHDASVKTDPEEERWLSEFKNRPALHIYNKCDIGGGEGLYVSFKNEIGLDLLAAKIESIVSGAGLACGQAPVSTIEKECLRAALEIGEAMLRQEDGCQMSEEMIVEDAKAAMAKLDAVAGAHSASEMLEKMFSRFCIGK